MDAADTHVTLQQRQDWNRDGWLVLEDPLPGHAGAKLSAWVSAVSQPGAPRDRRLHYFERTAEGRALCRTERFLDDHPQLGRLITTGLLPAVASELIGERAVIYKEKINYKQRGGAGFRPHQDARAYAFIRRHVTCLVAVDAMTIANGCLELAPHGIPTLLAEDGDGCIATEVAARLDWRPVEVPAGGVVFFGSHVPHRSGPNRRILVGERIPERVDGGGIPVGTQQQSRRCTSGNSRAREDPLHGSNTFAQSRHRNEPNSLLHGKQERGPRRVHHAQGIAFLSGEEIG